jgi:hypothetical protein
MKTIISKKTYIIIDTTNNHETVKSDDVIIHTEETCRLINPLHKDIKYSLDSVIWHVYDNIKYEDFDYVWILEDDVYCDGNFDKVIEKNNSKNEDFLASFVENYGDSEKEINWMHWEALHSEKNRNKIPRKEDRVKSFFPVTRYSKKFIKEIYDSIGIYSGYCEVYIPTLAKQKGYTYDNIENTCIGKLTTGFIDQMPNNKDDRLYHKWKK